MNIILLITFVITLLASSVGMCGVITPQDLVHVGSFSTPTSVGYASGITLREINGTLYAYCLVRSGTYKGHVYRYKVPSDSNITKNAPYYTVSNSDVVSYGDIFQDKIVDVNSNGSGNTTIVSGVANVDLGFTKLYWDDTDSRMYWVRIIGYENYISGVVTSNPAIGYSILNDSELTGTGVGTWKISPPYTQGGYGNRWAFNMAEIPERYRESLGGRRLAVGFGGGSSIITTGPASIGPAVFAINPPSLSNEDHLAYMQTPPVRLLSHLYGVEDLPLRDESMPGLNMRVDPFTSGKWFHEDGCFDGAWVEWGDKRGILFFAKMGGGSTNTTVAEIITASQIRVASIGDLRVGDLIRVNVSNPSNPSYNFEVRKVTEIINDIVTFDSAITQGIVVGGFVQSGSFYGPGGSTTSHWWTPLYIYDPDALILSITDPVNHPPGGEQPTSKSNFAFPGNIYPLNGSNTTYSTYGVPAGVAFDKNTGRVYVATTKPEGLQDVHIYQIVSSKTLRLSPGQARKASGTGRFIQ